MLNVNVSNINWDLTLWNLTLWISTALIGFTTFYIARFYLSLKDYPPGPLPLPLVGNILMLKGTTKSPFQTFADMQKKYGDIYTFWVGNWPIVVIFDLDLAKDAFNRAVFSGRPQLHITNIINGDGNGIIFAEFGPVWEILRKIGHSAVRKFSISERLPVFTSDSVDEMMAKLIEECEENKFDPKIYLKLIVEQTMVLIAYGRNEKDLRFSHDIIEEAIQLATKVVIADFIPIMRFPLANVMKKLGETIGKLKQVVMKEFMQHKADYQHGVIRDFADALIASKEEAIKEGHENVKYLNDLNLMLTLMDLFGGGTDTTIITLRWSLLLMANYPEIQLKLRQEIASQIGDRIPVQNDKNSCHYVSAYISEVMRFRGVAPMSIFHGTLNPSQIAGHKIGKDALLFIHHGFILNNPKYWTNPEVFNPDRFLDSEGKILANKNVAFIPFGVGRRSCPGEKLAMANFFLILMRILQQTEGYCFVLPNGAGSADLEPDPNELPIMSSPKQFQLILRKVL